MLLLPLQLASCATWKVQSVPPPVPNHVRLVLREGEPVELWNVSVVADSIIGWQGNTRVSVPAGTVVRMETRGVNTVESAGLGLGIVVGALVAAIVVLLIYCSSGTYACGGP